MGPRQPDFPLKKKKLVLKDLILPEMHIKANPTTQPRDYQDGGSKRAESGLIKVKKQVDFKIHFIRFKAFLDHVFSIKGGGWLGPDPSWKIPLTFSFLFETTPKGSHH